MVNRPHSHRLLKRNDSQPSTDKVGLVFSGCHKIRQLYQPRNPNYCFDGRLIDFMFDNWRWYTYKSLYSKPIAGRDIHKVHRYWCWHLSPIIFWSPPPLFVKYSVSYLTQYYPTFTKFPWNIRTKLCCYFSCLLMRLFNIIFLSYLTSSQRVSNCYCLIKSMV